MSSEARLAPSDRSSTDKRASISLATRSLGGTLDMGLVSSPVFSSANHFRGTRPFPFYRHSRTLPVRRFHIVNIDHNIKHRVEQIFYLRSAQLLGPGRIGPLRRLGEHVRESLRVSRYRALNVPSDQCIDVQIGSGGRTSSATCTPGYSHEQYEHPNKQREPS